MSWLSIAAQAISAEKQEQVVQLAADQLDHLALPVKRDRLRLEVEARPVVIATLSRQGLITDPALQNSLVQRVVARIGGLGFIYPMLPGKDYDPGYSEIALNPDGSVWVQKQGAEYFEKLDLNPSLEEVWRAVESLLAPLGRSITESTPSVDAKLPRSEGMGGARIKVIHPILAPGSGYPAINIRLFQARPVSPDLLIRGETAPPEVVEALLEHVADRLRVLVIGGTGTGKTTLLSALCSAIPKQARIVKIEDPEEIWLDHPNTVTLEARPSQVGSSVPAYTLQNGVDDAMRLAPRWLIVGEVRDGNAAFSLFRAQMSDHPGLSTTHAESPEATVKRIGLLMLQDRFVPREASREVFAEAVDLVIQVGWREGRRRILGVWEVAGAGGGEVYFNPLYTFGESKMIPSQRKR